MNLFASPEHLKDYLHRFQFRPNDLLGQNFLVDEAMLERIVEAAELQPTDEVLEIGSGIGNLTRPLAEKAGKVLAVEKDQRLYPILKDQLGSSLRPKTRTPKSTANVELVFSDIMSFNFQEILAPGYKVVANIPYYITGKITEMLLAARSKPSRIVLLMQKEVAERIVAGVGELSILAISVQLYCSVSLAGYVPKESFYPQPKVDSAIVVMDVLTKPRFDVDEKKFFRIIKAAFLGKRKQIHNSLQNNLKLEKKTVDIIFALGIVEPQARPQDISLEQWFKIYEVLAKEI